MKERDTKSTPGDKDGEFNIGAMSDSQFSASLDALLESEVSDMQPAVARQQQQPEEASALPDSPASQFINAPISREYTAEGANLFGKQIEFAKPEPVQSSTTRISKHSRKSGHKTKPTGAVKHLRDFSAISEDESEVVRRRHDRNQREQMRSQKITHQIEYLKQLLQDAQVEFKNDKFHTLSAVVEYVRKLQERNILLESEHKKLLDTISKTSDMVEKPLVHEDAKPAAIISNNLFEDRSDSPPEDESMLFVQGIDYEAIFRTCPTAFAIVSLDGRFLACNHAFEVMVGFARVESEYESETADENASAITSSTDGLFGTSQSSIVVKRNMSLFDIVRKDDMNALFSCMSDMLKGKSIQGGTRTTLDDRWHGRLMMSKKDFHVNMHLSLVRGEREQPRFFTCSLLHV